MKFIKTPVKGTNDILPSEMRLRQSILNKMRVSYSRYGFEEIETPIMEHIENLTSKQGGDNEKLIFKIMKRGAELSRAMENGGELSDMGLRYDLTVPLARYYANNAAKIPSPFKAMQLAPVFRADNPQKGRFRQFMQCDIDVLGDPTNCAEIELISATADMLSELLKGADVGDITVRINDRRILTAAAKHAGFSLEDVPSLLISLDKLDKIGYEGVQRELIEKGYDSGKVAEYLSLYKASCESSSCAEFCKSLGEVDGGVVSNLCEIIDCCTASVPENINIKFDPTLVRGMGYYTGPIFEVGLGKYSFSVAGGGRYDEMIEKFSGMKTEAVGFSIGFERIVTVLSDSGVGGINATDCGIAFLVDKSVPTARKMEIFNTARALRDEGKVVTVQSMKRNLKAQISDLEKSGYADFRKIYND